MPGTFAAAAAAAGFTSWTTNSTPALARFVAIGIPILPNPTKPTVSMGSPFTDSPRGARRRASAAAARLALPFVWQVRLAVECSAFARREECVGVTAVRARASTAQPSWGWLGGGRRGPLRLHQGPGIADPARVDREPPALDEGVGPPLERRALGGGQQRGELRGKRRGEEAPHVGEEPSGNRLAAEVPDDGAKLRLHVEAETVVDGVDDALGCQQAVAGLPVGVVGDEVEDADPLETLVVRGALAEGEVMLLEVGRDEELERAFAGGSLAPR